MPHGSHKLYSVIRSREMDLSSDRKKTIGLIKTLEANVRHVWKLTHRYRSRNKFVLSLERERVFGALPKEVV